ncbi:glycine betaine ABC transporter substrate-binding protein, partial [Streptomyces scabiei]|uniref:glycine betaine ABC transporter substrate-binding protein n=1 Tax=Streptomyces scabiei TaxID=1930 RepID=UPI0038F6CEC2
KAVAEGNADASVSAWLPTTHQGQYAQYSNNLDDLGSNMDGTSLGLAVPAYMNIKSIAELNNQAQRQIIGIEPGAGIMARTEEALDS